MTHNKDDVQRISELNATFLSLNDKDKDSALAILRTLRFAQAVMGADTYGTVRTTGRQQAAGTK